MPKTVQPIKWKPVLLAELIELEVRSVVIHRLAVPFYEQAVGIYPLVADQLCKFVLLSLKFHYGSREFYSPLRTLSFGGICVDSLFCRVA